MNNEHELEITERVDREVKEALEIAHCQLDAAGVPRCIRVDDDVVDFDLTDRIEILALRASLVHGIGSARDLARRIAFCLHPAQGGTPFDHEERERIELVVTPLIDRAWKRKPDYDEIVARFASVSISMLPGLLGNLVEQCARRNVFQPGRLLPYCASAEARALDLAAKEKARAGL